MASGVTCSDKCVEVYNEIKLKKNNRFILYKIEKESEIVIDKCGEKSKTFEEFRSELEACSTEARFAVLDYEQGPNKTALVFVSWIPDNAAVRTKMLYASSVDALKRKLLGVKAVIEINDLEDVSREHFDSCLPAAH